MRIFASAVEAQKKSANVTPYRESEATKKVQVKRMFDRIAPSYDFLNHFLSLGIDRIWRRRAIAQLNDLRPQEILDIATGTGDLALQAAKSLQPKSIIGVDIATRMLEIADRKKNKKAFSTAITFEEGDAEQLRFEDASFDAAMVAFGVRNFGALEKGLEEIYRVLRNGGRFVVLEFTKPKVFPFKQIYDIYFRYILPLIGRVTSKDPRAYKYLYESVQAFPDYEKFEQILRNTGFTKTRHEVLTFGICAIYVAEK